MLTFTGFGLRDVAIATVPTSPGTPPNWIDIPAVESAAFKLNVSEVEQYGDDQYLGTYYHSQKGSITVKATKLSMQVFEVLSGNSVGSAGGAESIFFGTTDELIPPRVMVRGITPVRLEDGSVGEMTSYWYNCDVKTVWDSLPGSERAKLVEVNLTFNSYISDQDHEGNPLSSPAFGHFVVSAS